MVASEVAQFRQQQAMREEAALLGLHGLSSGRSRHEVINARMERGADYILGLIQAGKHEKAEALMKAKTWADIEADVLEEEERKTCHTTIPS